MSSPALAAGIRQLRRSLAAQQLTDESDEQLLHAFTSRRDDSAYAALMRRHGPMVLRVCRRVLGNEQDAEDAFQATFLVLARNAASLRNKTALASWLHGTAYRTALKAKQAVARRSKHEGSRVAQLQSRSPANPSDELLWHEVREMLDEEISLLPETYRSVFVLCCMEELSQAEAGRRLGMNERTVSNRLAEVRKRLSQRLADRGVELAALAGAAALLAPPVSALPPALMASTLEAALATAAGGNAARMVSASVAPLAAPSPPILSIGKATLAVLLFTASLLGGGALVHFQAAAVDGDAPSAEKANSQSSAAAAGKEDKENAVYAGRVLDPDGKPIAGAKLYLLYYTPKELPIPVRATSDKDGRFRFTVDRKDFDQSASARPWDEAIVVATANGYGVGVPDFQRGGRIMPTDWELRLCKDDVPITGRFLDLQGKPVAGASVSIHRLFWPAKEDLAAFLTDLKQKKEVYPALRAHLSSGEGGWIGCDLGKIFPPVASGADGRFVLRGIGRERVVTLRLQGPTITSAELFAMTRPGDAVRVASWRRGELGGEMTFCGSTFEHIAAPGQTIIGVVRDKDIGKPLPRAIVRSYVFAARPRLRIAGQTHLHAVADKDGRYRLDGMPRGEGNVIRAEGPEGQPYLMSLADVPKGFALEPVSVDFQLKRGVWIEGKVTERATGKPVHSVIRCAVFPDNTFRKEAPGLTFEGNMNRAWDGTFRFATVPGRSVITAQSLPQPYLTNVGADRIKGLDRLHLLDPYNTVVEINPPKDAKSVKCDIVLESGGTLSGSVLGPDRRPLSGTRVAGLGPAGYWQNEPLRTAAFTVLALRPDETRLLQFAHAEKHLAGSLLVRGGMKGPLTVTLKPAGTLRGRFITRDGKPLADLVMFSDRYGPIADPSMLNKPPDPSIGTFPLSIRTDKDGKFRIEDLAPGLKYRFVLSKGKYALTPDGPTGSGVIVKEGETKDLGDVTVKLIE
jgi:RNA polymerase sigma factor (sigma-70 family)